MRLGRPIGFALVLLAGHVAVFLLPAPAWVDAGAERVALSGADLFARALAAGWAVLALAALACCWAGGGRTCVAAARFLVGFEDEAAMPRAHRGLRAAARASVAGGLVLGLAVAAAAFLLLRPETDPAAPARVARLVAASILVPTTALALGVLVLGPAADAAAARAGEPWARAFDRGDDLLLLLHLVPAALTLTVVTLSFEAS